MVIIRKIYLDVLRCDICVVLLFLGNFLCKKQVKFVVFKECWLILLKFLDPSV